MKLHDINNWVLFVALFLMSLSSNSQTNNNSGLEIIDSNVTVNEYGIHKPRPDSAGYRFYYALEIINIKDEETVATFHEGVATRLTARNRSRYKGIWLFKSYPDTVIIRQPEKDDIILNINDVIAIEFRYNVDRKAGVELIAEKIINPRNPLDKFSLPNILLPKNNLDLTDWSNKYTLFRKKWLANLTIISETVGMKYQREQEEKRSKEKLEGKK